MINKFTSFLTRLNPLRAEREACYKQEIIKAFEQKDYDRVNWLVSERDSYNHLRIV